MVVADMFTFSHLDGRMEKRGFCEHRNTQRRILSAKSERDAHDIGRGPNHDLVALHLACDLNVFISNLRVSI